MQPERQQQYQVNDPEIQKNINNDLEKSTDQLQLFLKKGKPNRGDPENPVWFCCCCGCLPLISFVKSFITFIPVTLIYFVGCTIANLVHFPQTVMQMVYTVIVMQRIGPNLKVVGVLSVPFILFFYIPFQLGCCICLGLGVGLFVPVVATFIKEYSLVCGGITHAFQFAIYHVKKYWNKHNKELFEKLREIREEQIPKEQRKDVYFFYIIFGLIVYMLSACIQLIAFSIIGLIFYIPGTIFLYGKLNQSYLRKFSCWRLICFPFYLIALVIMPAISLILVLIFILSSIITALKTYKKTYFKGIIEGVKECFTTIKDYYGYVKKSIDLQQVKKDLKKFSYWILCPLFFVLKLVLCLFPVLLMNVLPPFFMYILYLPKHLFVIYRTLFNVKYLGPNLKFLICLVLPLGFLAFPFVQFICNIFYGFDILIGGLCKHQFKKDHNYITSGIKLVFEDSVKLIKDVANFHQEEIDKICQEQLEIEKTQQNYYEVSIIYAIIALAFLFFNVTLYFFSFIFVGFLQFFPIITFAYKYFYVLFVKNFNPCKAVMIPFFILFQPFIGIGVIGLYFVFVFSAIIFGIPSCRSVYYNGLKKGIQDAIQKFKQINQRLAEWFQYEFDIKKLMLGFILIVIIPIFLILKLVVSVLLVGPIYMILQILISLFYIPRNIILGWTTICKQKQVGINLKCLGVVLFPFIYLICIIGCSLFFILEVFFYSIYLPFKFQSLTFKGIVFSGIQDAIYQNNKHLHEIVEYNGLKYHQKCKEIYEKPLAGEKQKPFDIYFFYILYAFIIGAIGFIITFFINSIIGILKFLPAIYGIFKKCFSFESQRKDNKHDPIFLICIYLAQLICLVVLSPIITLILFIAFVIATPFIGLFQPLIKTYEIGIIAGFKQIFTLIKEQHEYTNEYIGLKNFKQVIYVYTCCQCLPVLAIIKSALLCIPVGFITFTSYAILFLVHFIQHLFLTYYTLWKYQLLGLNLKFVFMFIIWIPIVLQTILGPIFGLLVGLFNGLATPIRMAYQKGKGVCFRDIIEVYNDMIGSIKECHKYCAVTFIAVLKEQREKKPEKEAFDIYFAYIILAIFITFFSILFNIFIFTLLNGFKVVPAYVKIMRECYNYYFQEVKNCCLKIICLPILILAHILMIPISILIYVLSILFGGLMGFKNLQVTYNIGFYDAISSNIKIIGQGHEAGNEFCNLDNVKFIQIIYLQLLVFGAIGAVIYFLA